MEDETLLGFLRFGPEKEGFRSVAGGSERRSQRKGYRQNAGETLDLAGEGQRTALSAVGCGRITRQHRECMKCWGFLPDGRIAPVMIKEKKG